MLLTVWLARAYARLQRGLDFYHHWICLPFDEAAAASFDQLRAQKLRIGTNDLAIAAITLAVNGTLVTRNTVDFQRIPGLVSPPSSRRRLENVLLVGSSYRTLHVAV